GGFVILAILERKWLSAGLAGVAGAVSFYFAHQVQGRFFLTTPFVDAPTTPILTVAALFLPFMPLLFFLFTPSAVTSLRRGALLVVPAVAFFIIRVAQGEFLYSEFLPLVGPVLLWLGDLWSLQKRTNFLSRRVFSPWLLVTNLLAIVGLVLFP